jgi:cytochrome c553
VALVAGFVLLAAAIIMLISEWRLGQLRPVTVASLPIPDDSATITRGRHLATAIAKCTGCHGEDLSGRVMQLGPIGALTAGNLTGGEGGFAPKSDGDWIRAIRHGLAPDDRPLVFMPSMVYAVLSGPDLAAIIAYVKSVPPVDNDLPSSELGPLGRLLVVTQPKRLVPADAVDHSAPLPAAIPPGATPEYGEYLSVVAGCTYCHRDDLTGGLKEGPPGMPPSTDLTLSGPLAEWGETDFRTALRTGRRPDGSDINRFMPWRLTRLMTDEEISALWVYLRTLKPREADAPPGIEVKTPAG